MAAALPAVQALVDQIETDDNAIKSRCQLALQLSIKLDEPAGGGAGETASAPPALAPPKT